MSPNEARTRREHIDPALRKAGWDVSDPTLVGIGFLVGRSTVMSMRSIQPHSHRVESMTTPACRGVGDWAMLDQHD